jgi:hypothetical protein
MMCYARRITGPFLVTGSVSMFVELLSYSAGESALRCVRRCLYFGVTDRPTDLKLKERQFKLLILNEEGKGKGLPQQAEVTQGIPGRLRPRIFLTFSTTRVVGCQPYAPAAFYPKRNPWYTFLEPESTPRAYGSVGSYGGKKIPSDTTGNRSRDRPTSSAMP